MKNSSPESPHTTAQEKSEGRRERRKARAKEEAVLVAD